MKKNGQNHAPNSMTELRRDLSLLYADIRAGRVRGEAGAEAGRIAAKIIKSADVQRRYAVDRREKPSIPFMR